MVHCSQWLFIAGFLIGRLPFFHDHIVIETTMGLMDGGEGVGWLLCQELLRQQLIAVAVLKC